MKITLNIILDSLRDYKLESQIDESADIGFRQARLLEENEKDFDKDFLYVGMLSDAIAASKRTQDIFFLCIDDKNISEDERENFLSSLIIVHENLTQMKLLNHVQKYILVIQEWYEAMQDAVINQKGIQELLDLGEPIIGNFMSINDSAFSLVAYTRGISIDDKVSKFLVKNGYHSPETMEKFKRHKRYVLWFNAGEEIVISADRAVSDYIVVNRVFVYDENNFTNVVMNCNNREPSPGLLDLYKMLVSFLEYYIERDLKERRYSIYSSLISDLMTGKLSDYSVVAERAKSVGILPEAETAVMLLAERESEHIIFSDRIVRDIMHEFQYITPVNYNQRLLLLLNHPNIHLYLSKHVIGEKLNKFLEKNGLFCGISDTIINLLELPSAYLQAEFALANRENISRLEKGKTAWPRFGNIISFGDHYTELLLNHDKKTDQIWRSSKYGKMLIQLQRSDDEKNTNNLEILYSFLIHERRATDTAAALYMHRNNVLYRIGRIEEMFDISLEDPATRLNLLITFLLLGKTDSAAPVSIIPKPSGDLKTETAVSG